MMISLSQVTFNISCAPCGTGKVLSGESMLIVSAERADGDVGAFDVDPRGVGALDVDAMRPADGDRDAVVIPAEHAVKERPAAQAVMAMTVRRVGVIIGYLPGVLLGVTAQN